MILDRTQVARYLAIAHEVGQSQRLYDVHVSPYEVIFDAVSYRADPQHDGVYAATDARYRPPSPGPLRLGGSPARAERAEDPAVPGELSAMMYRRRYAHLGPRVLADHMAASGIATSLLIPVARAGTDGGDQLRLMFELYPRDDARFAFAYSPPATVPVQALASEVERVAARYPIAALKVHPNLQAIDLASPAGRERIEALLDACDRTRLPVMVHGGRSTVVGEGGHRGFATLDHLAPIPWGEAGVPVILGHAGLFGCTHDEAVALLPALGRLLAANPAMVVELSGLGIDTLREVLRAVELDRIVFGSDALYFPQWGAVVTLLHALDTLGLPAAETLARLAGSNPARILASAGEGRPMPAHHQRVG